jgi:drug/metabolite transporter (DMT)-like permease
MLRTSFLASLALQLATTATAVAQTAFPEGPPPGGPATPAGTEGGGWAWIWIVVVLTILGLSIWYGAQRRRRR